jgi:acyl carrier protein
MVPTAFLVLDGLPLSANGKVDRGALPAPDAARPGVRKELVLPSTAEEKVLAGIWAQVLGVEQVSVDIPFFEIGGDSLLAVQLISRVRDTLRVELSLRDLFDSMTVAEMARQVVARETTPGQTRKLARILVIVQGMGADKADKAAKAEVGAQR